MLKGLSKVFVDILHFDYCNRCKQEQKEEDGEIQVYCKMLKIIKTVS